MPQDTPNDWTEVETHFDRLLDLPETERTKTLRDIAKTNPAMARELRELLTYAGQDAGPLDRPALGRFEAEPASPGLELGRIVGPYSITALLGRGGMGEVYLAERTDGQFEQQVALKLIRPEAIDNMARFQFERQTLARLEHPNITRIYDGGVLEDGRPYMVMELVSGQPITSWCRRTEADLDTRLTLFLSLCEAVAHAHANLVVHRDLKPGNVLVTAQGAVKVLDFGIAKQIGSLDTQIAPVTPAYAAPEQLTGGTISTATDTYALGMLLYELLAGTRPWKLEDLPLAAAVDVVVNQPLPSLSKFDPGLAGDLDSIVAKALRKEAEHRYQTVEALIEDIERYRNHLPVSAREGSRFYVVGRFIRRHRLPIAAASITLLAVVAGLIGISVEYMRAEKEATRATAIKSFLVSLFNDSDPNFPTDKPRDQVSANDLIALGAARIDRDFSKAPDLKIELLDTIESIYSNMSETQKSLPLIQKSLDDIKERRGPLSADYLRKLNELADANEIADDLDEMEKILATSDPLITRAGFDESDIRAEWWLLKGHDLEDRTGSLSEQTQAYDKATDIFARFAPDSDSYSVVLTQNAINHSRMGDYRTALDLNRQALALAQKNRKGIGADPTRVATAMRFVGDSLENLGEFSEADRIYQQSAQAALAGGGTSSPEYWAALLARGYLLHLQGNRDGAMAVFDEYLSKLPPNPYENMFVRTHQTIYALCLSSEGRAGLAIPILEAIAAKDRATKMAGIPNLATLLILGDAYDRVGRTEEARRTLREANDVIQAEAPGTSTALVGNERWARFQLDHSDAAAAGPIFDALIGQQDHWIETSNWPSQSWAGRARVALSAGKVAEAVDASAMALSLYDKIKASHDVRVHAQLLLVRSKVMLAAGNRQQAIQDAETALADSRRTDAPESPAIRQAELTLAEARRIK